MRSTDWLFAEGVREGKGAKIGFPFVGTTVRLELLTPPDEVGPKVAELWLAGPSLAIEYVRERERTARCFPVIDGRRWYRTGDLCAFDESGLLHFYGRRGNQVKIPRIRVGMEGVGG